MLLPELESSRTSLASRTHFEVLGLGLQGQVLGLGLEASSPRKLACPRLEDSSIFWIVKILWSAWKIFWKTFFCGDRLKNFCEDLFFFFFFGDRLKNFCASVLGPWPWPRAFLFLASRVSVLGKAVLGLGLGFFCVLGLGLEPCVLGSTSGCCSSSCFEFLSRKRAKHFVKSFSPTRIFVAGGLLQKHWPEQTHLLKPTRCSNSH